MKKVLVKIIILTLSVIYMSPFVLSQTGKKPAKILKNGELAIVKMDVLNSKYQEANLSITPDGKYLFFMSENPSSWSTPNYGGREGRYDGDIWYSQKINNKWQKPKNLGRTINTPLGEDEPNVSPDGQMVYFQSWRSDWKTSGGPYYKAELSGANWKNPVGLNSGITKFFKSMNADGKEQLATDGATFSPDGTKFVVAFGKDYEGNMDLYLSKINSSGEWSDFIKLSVNTPYNERCPFLAADGKTLYFASNGYNGFGKLDIYKTTLNDDGTCGEVINIGEPFNTKDDDYGFVLTATGDEAYFIRNQEIYYVDLRKNAKEIKPNPIVIIDGTVKDKSTNKPVESIVKITDKSTGRVMGTSRSNANTGEYSIVLQKGKDYIQSVNKEKYNNFRRDFSLPEEATTTEIKYDIGLDPKAEVSVEKCLSKLFNPVFSIGLSASIPLSYGVKAEMDYWNFGAALSGIHFPNVGQLDETKPSDDLKSDNYSDLVLLAFLYHIPVTCDFYPFVGIYGGLQFRHWKKDVGTVQFPDIESGDYTAYHYGLTLGLKYFLNEKIYLEGSLGMGKNSVHAQSAIDPGKLLKWEYQFLGWFSIGYNFDLNL